MRDINGAWHIVREPLNNMRFHDLHYPYVSGRLLVRKGLMIGKLLAHKISRLTPVMFILPTSPSRPLQIGPRAEPLMSQVEEIST